MQELNVFQSQFSNFNYYSYCSRRIQPVELPNGETYLFFVDQCPDSGELDFDITKNVSGSEKQITQSKITTKKFPIGMRTLVGCRAGMDGMAVSGIKWVGWRSQEEGDENFPWKYYPFFEVYDFSVVYNKALNKIALYFWTNILDFAEGEVPENFDYDKVAFQFLPGQFVSISTSPDYNSVRKVMCCASGRFVKASVNATMMPDSDPDYGFKKCLEYIPIFERPVIIHEYSNMDSKITDYGDGSGGDYTGTWEISFDNRLEEPEGGGDAVLNKYARFKNCYSRRGGIFIAHESSQTVIEVAIPEITNSEKLYVGVKIDTNNNAYEIVFATDDISLLFPNDTALNKLFVVIPLYELKLVGNSFRVTCDLRKTITQDIYE